jgi:hypothetical protein
VLEKRAEMGRQLDLEGWGHIADDKEERIRNAFNAAATEGGEGGGICSVVGVRGG